MKYVCIFFVRIYQKCISPLFPPSCRFTPSCSAYAVEAFRIRGFFIGLYLTVWRILRCNPFCRPGYDPVPLPKRAIYRRIPKYDRIMQERERTKRK